MQRKRAALTVVAAAEAAGSASEDPLERYGGTGDASAACHVHHSALSKVVGPAAAGTTVTLGFIALWYALLTGDNTGW